MHTAGHEIVARALRRALGQHRRFDLQKAVFREVFMRDPRDLVAHHEIPLHTGTPKIQITVLQAQQFARVAVVARIDRRCLGGAQDLELPNLHFDLAGLHVRIDHVAGARFQNAPDRKNILGTDRACAIEILLRQRRRIEDDLHQSRAVTKLHKDQRAEVAANIRPPHQRHFSADVLFRKLRAVARAFPSAQKLSHFLTPSVSSSQSRPHRGGP